MSNGRHDKLLLRHMAVSVARRRLRIWSRFNGVSGLVPAGIASSRTPYVNIPPCVVGSAETYWNLRDLNLKRTKLPATLAILSPRLAGVRLTTYSGSPLVWVWTVAKVCRPVSLIVSLPGVLFWRARRLPRLWLLFGVEGAAMNCREKRRTKPLNL